MHLKLGEVSTMVVTSPQLAKDVMKTHDAIFAQRPPLLASRIMSYDFTDIAFAPYGEYWRMLRKICITELLSPKRVQLFRSVREDEVWSFVKKISSSANKTINLSQSISDLIYGLTSTSAFGKKTKEQDAFVAVVTEVAELIGGFCLADLYPSFPILGKLTGTEPKLEKLHHKADSILEEIVKEHKQRRKGAEGQSKEAADEDLVDVLLRVQETNEYGVPLSPDNIKAVLNDMFSAGSETSAATIEWAFSEMLKNPSMMKKAQEEVKQAFQSQGNVDEVGVQDLKYLKLIIKETLRLHPPVPLLLQRENSEKCSLYGYELPPKTKVIINAWAIGRDPKHWTNPETFYPERFLDSSIDYKGTDFEYVPFGAGRRICPGISFAMASVELSLAHLLFHFDWKLANEVKPGELDMDEAFGLTVRRKHDLFVIPIPRHPLPAATE